MNKENYTVFHLLGAAKEVIDTGIIWGDGETSHARVETEAFEKLVKIVYQIESQFNGEAK